MKILLPVLFAAIAAIGNALFALGQKKSAGVDNGLAFVALSALVAVCLAGCCAPLLGTCDVGALLKGNWKAMLLGGGGLFLTYLGFNLLYSRYGVAPYFLYAVLSIITTTLLVGMLWLKEPVNFYHKAAMLLGLVSVVLFSLGQAKG